MIQTFLTCAFSLNKDSLVSYQKEKMNKRIKKYNYVKRENVVIATYLHPQVVWPQKGKYH